MDRLKAILDIFKNNQLFSFIKNHVYNHPYLTIFLLSTSTILQVLRMIHYKFVVFPQIGGRRNESNNRGNRHPSQRNIDCEDIQITTQKGLILRGWYMKRPDAQRIIIYFHQNAGNIGGRIYYCKQLMQNSKTNVILVSYRGFSDSDGDSKPTEANIIADSGKIFEYAITISKRDNLPLFALGRSLGGAAAIGVFSQQKYQNNIRGIILQNTFTSIYDVAKGFLPSALYLLRIPLWIITSGSYNSLSRIGQVRAPILFIRGAKDQLVRPWMMTRLEQECANRKREHYSLQIKDGSHNDTWAVGGQTYFQTVSQFFGQCQRM